MLHINIASNFPQVKAAIDSTQRQMRFAVAAATTWIAQDVREAQKVEMRSVFDRPNAFTLGALYLQPATFATMTARVWVKDTYRVDHYLLSQIMGGGRPLKRFERMLVERGVMQPSERAVPGAGAKLDGYGNMGRGQIVKILSQLQAFNLAGSTANASGAKRSRAKRSREAYFVSTGVGKHPYGGHSWSKGRKAQHLPRGIWVRHSFGAWGTAVQPVLLFVSKDNYRVRFRFAEVAQNAVNRVAGRHLDTAIKRALDSAWSDAKRSGFSSRSAAQAAGRVDWRKPG